MARQRCWRATRKVLCLGFVSTAACALYNDWFVSMRLRLTSPGSATGDQLQLQSSSRPTPGAAAVLVSSQELRAPLHGLVDVQPAESTAAAPEPTAAPPKRPSHQADAAQHEQVPAKKPAKRPPPPSPKARGESDAAAGEGAVASQVAAGDYVPVVHSASHECKVQAKNFGKIWTAEGCDELSAAEPSCGEYYMFSVARPDWQCRCCAPDSADKGPFSVHWAVYKVLKTRTPVTVAPPSTPAAAKGNKLGPLYLQGRECAKQAIDFGRVDAPADCDQVAANTEECGEHFMFNKAHPDWGCRCCAPGSTDGGPRSTSWDVYNVLTPRPKVFEKTPTLAPMRNAFAGLPVAEGARPDWLIKEDQLVIDARDPPGSGGILILQAVLMDVRSDWGKTAGPRPHWLRAILATNRQHARKHGHAMILRAQPTQPQLTAWQWRQCLMKDVADCVKRNERENYNWEKHLMLAEYLLSPQKFSHVLMLDADAALIRHEHDTLREIAKVLDQQGKDLFLTDEDWLEFGEGRINGGLIFAKNTEFTRGLFQDTFDAHIKGGLQHLNWRIGVPRMECSSNEQICLNDLWQGTGKPYFAPHAMMAGGKRYNRGAERGGVTHIRDQDVEVMHWMGASKPSAGPAICGYATDFTGEGPEGYGCRL